MVKGIGGTDHSLAEEQVRSLIEEGTSVHLFDRKRVLVLTPDATRTCPLPMMIRSVREIIGARAAKLDFMVALGTHTPLAEKDILKLYGIDDRTKGLDGTEFFNHEWGRPDSFYAENRIDFRPNVRAVKLARTERVGRYYSGLASYPAWSGMLKEDQAFAAADAAGIDTDTARITMHIMISIFFIFFSFS